MRFEIVAEFYDRAVSGADPIDAPPGFAAMLRERKRRQAGWCEVGSPLHIRFPEAVHLAKRLHRANPVTSKRRSLRKISAELAAAGHKMVRKYRGSQVPRPFNPATIKAMIEGPAPASGEP